MTTAAELISLVYSSTATAEFGDEELAQLLHVCRANNARLDVTGILLYRDGRFLQVLEGSREAVHSLMMAIARDPRHDDVRILLEDRVGERSFPEWTMAFEALSEQVSHEMPGYRVAFTDTDAHDEEDERHTVRVLRELIRWFRVRAARVA
jgi:hypothetical protein